MPKLIKCPNCAKPTFQNATFCQHCGKRLNRAVFKGRFLQKVFKVVKKKIFFIPLTIVLLGLISVMVFLAVSSAALPLLSGCSSEAAAERAKKATVQVKTEYGFGSGFFIDQNHVVTNNHVVEEVQDAEIALSDGLITNGRVIGWDNQADIAVIEVQIQAPEILKWARKGRVGSELLAIGFPLPLEEPLRGDATITEGTLSAFRKGLNGTEYVQTDTIINPGNSGGALVDSCGRVVGVNVLSWKTDPRHETVFYAISADSAKSTVQNILANPTFSVPQGTLPSFEGEQDPELVVASYYDLINLGDRFGAYSLFTQKRRQQWPPDKWEELFADVYWVDVHNVERQSEDPIKVKAEVTLYSRDSRNNDLRTMATSIWTVRYSVGQLSLDDVEVNYGETVAVYPTEDVSLIRDTKIRIDSFYASILKKDLDSYSQDKVSRIKELISANLEIIDRIYKKITSDSPLDDRDIFDLAVFDSNDEDIRSINQEFEEIDLKRYYDYYFSY